MEVRGQDKEIATPSCLGYNRDSSSKVSLTTPSTATVHGDAILNSSQTLDHNHLYHHHHHHHHHQQHQLINPPQDTRNRPSSPDPVPAPITTTTSTDRSTPPTPPATTATATTLLIRYRECLKNHAASMGGHVVDGCGEFMPGGEEGTREALKCAACDCHRNFHRKETDGASSESTYLANSYYNKKFYHHPHHQHQHLVSPQQQQPPAPFYHHSNNNNHHRRLPLGLSNSTTPIATAPVVAPLMMAFGGGGAAESSSEDLNMFHSNAGGQSSVQQQPHPKYSKKRFRTKFSQEQKDKMMELAEKIGWRIQKQDEEEVQEFCAQVGVKRQVFKVWMHNNKQLVKKKEM